ncbi:MAG: hypothetical protein NT080_06515 [Spirochaetes bacterium]|nr:hypothetical protein [Spirochaetota bacterium]
MKKLVCIAFAVAILVSGVFAQSLLDNSYYQRSRELKALANAAFEDGDYDAAADYAAQAEEYARLSDQYVDKMVALDRADRTMATAQEKMAWADSTGAGANHPESFETAIGAMEASEASYGEEDYETAASWAETVTSLIDEMYDAEKTRALEAKAAANDRMAWALEKMIGETYPAEYAAAGDEMTAAESTFVEEKFGESVGHSEAVLAALANAVEFTPFPASYVVRHIPGRADCLWRIAEYPFVYGNPLKWKVLYDANRRTFRDPANPDLIFPGQTILIPSLSGETRTGSYDPSLKYAVFE